jgi:hypothetical protein
MNSRQPTGPSSIYPYILQFTGRHYSSLSNMKHDMHIRYGRSAVTIWPSHVSDGLLLYQSWVPFV